MQILLNGEPHELAERLSVAELLSHLQLGQARVAVELNRRIVPLAERAGQWVAEGDQLEIVTFVGGG